MKDPRFDALVAELEELASTLRSQVAEYQPTAAEGRISHVAYADAYGNAANLIDQIIRDEKWGIPTKDEEPDWRSMGETVDHLMAALQSAQQVDLLLNNRVKRLERTVADLEERVEALGKGQVGPSGRGTWSATYGAEEAGGDS